MKLSISFKLNVMLLCAIEMFVIGLGNGQTVADDQFLIKLANGVTENRYRGTDGKWKLGILEIDDLSTNNNVKTIFKQFPDHVNDDYSKWYQVVFKSSRSDLSVIEFEYLQLSTVELTKPSYIPESELLQWGEYPVDDPYFNTEIPNWDDTYNRDFEQWWLYNDGNPIRQGHSYEYNSDATAGIDIDASNAWEIQEGREDVILAIWDSGIAYHHEDLMNNMWVNRFEDANSDGEFNIAIINRYTGLEDYNGHTYELRWHYCPDMFVDTGDWYFDGDRGDASCDWAPGLEDEDDDGDGYIDFDDPGVYYGILTDGLDSDGDGTNQDEPGGEFDDSPGTLGVDDDGDGIIDDYDGAIFDDDENGFIDDVHGFSFYNTEGWDVYNSDLNQGHGSAVAGIAAGNANNAKGVAGVCQNCKLMVNGYVYGGNFEKKLIYAMDNGWQSTPAGQTIHRRGVHVINMSWKSYSNLNFLNDEFTDAYDNHDILLVAAAGNKKYQTVRVPAIKPMIMAIAGLEPDGKRADMADNGGSANEGSTVGPEIEVCGPFAPIGIVNPVDKTQTNCCGEVPLGEYFKWDSRMSWYYSGWVGGTSNAAPVVSGVAGLVISELYDQGYYDYDVDLVRNIINTTAENVDNLNPGLEGELGNGLVNSFNAVDIISAPPENPKNFYVGAEGGTGGYPHLTWDANTEPDIDGYNIYRKITDLDRTYFYIDYVDKSVVEYTDYELIVGDRLDPEVCYKIEAVDIFDNVSSKTDPECVTYSGFSGPFKLGVDALPQDFTLHPAYPNPFNPKTTLRYDLPENSHVQISIYDLKGNLIKTLLQGLVSASFQKAVWDGVDDHGQLVASGVYLVRISAIGQESDEVFNSSQKILLMK